MRIRNKQDFSVKSANGKRGEIPEGGDGIPAEKGTAIGSKSRPATEEQMTPVTPEGSCEACRHESPSLSADKASCSLQKLPEGRALLAWAPE